MIIIESLINAILDVTNTLAILNLFPDRNLISQKIFFMKCETFLNPLLLYKSSLSLPLEVLNANTFQVGAIIS